MTVSPIYTQAPTQGLDETQQIVFDTLAELHIPFERVEHDWANTMEDCKAVSAVLGVDVCKPSSTSWPCPATSPSTPRT